MKMQLAHYQANTPPSEAHSWLLGSNKQSCSNA